MSTILVRKGRNRYYEYSVYRNADPCGEATRVRFGSGDRWVGNDYWKFHGVVTSTPGQRAYALMRYMERRGDQEQRCCYHIARVILLTSMGHGEIARQNFENWKKAEHDRRNKLTAGS